MFLVVGALGGIAVGELISRYDARWCIATGTLFIAITYYWLPAAHSLGTIYFAYAALGVGYAMTDTGAGTDKQAVSNGDQHPPAEENTLFFAHQTSCPFG